MAIFVLAHAKGNLETFVSQIYRIRPRLFKRKYLIEDLLYSFWKSNSALILFHCASSDSNRKSLACFVPKIFALKVERSLEKFSAIQFWIAEYIFVNNSQNIYSIA